MAENGAEAAYELAAGSFTSSDLRVVSFRGVEGLSRLFSFDVSITSELDGPSIEGLVEQPASLVLQSPSGAPRTVQGIVGSVRFDKPSTKGGRGYQLRVVPKLWLLRRRRNSRIFQNKTAQEIVTQLCDEAGIANRWAVTNVLPVPPYCVQYDETDYRFIRRILAERGIYFMFEASPEPDGTGTVVFCDGADGYAEVAGTPTIVFRDADQKTADEHVAAFVMDRDIRSKAMLVRDWDFSRPKLDLAASAQVGDDGTITAQTLASQSTRREYSGDEEDVAAPADDPEAQAGKANGQARPLEVYSHRGEYHDYDVNSNEPHMQLEQLRRRLRVGRGSGNCRGFIPGARFALEHHPAPDLDGSYVVVKIEHVAVVPERAATKDATLYENRFEVVPATTVYRPKRRPRHLHQVVESALVVGPPGEEIHTDEHGRIKVQFHWDREGVYDDNSTCWMRVMHAWSGSSWGHQFIPRIGMEVLVAFVGGDPDRPVVIGALPNTEQPTPFKLPVHKTKSGIRTSSSPGGDGYNELSFEDARGAEQVHLHAERDLSIQVGSDHSSVVEHDRIALVRGSREDSVLGARNDQVGESYRLRVEGDMQTHVAGNTTSFAAGFRDDVIEGEYTLRVDQAQTVMIGADPAEHRSSTFVVGDWSLGSDGLVRVKAANGIALECGENKITITKDEVKIEAATLTMKASKSVSVAGNGPAITLDDKAELAAKQITVMSEKTTMQLDEVVDIRAPTVKLNCTPEPTKSKDPSAPPPKTAKFSVRLTDPNFEPYAKKKYHLFAGVDRYDGETDDNGLVSQDLPDGIKRVDITLWVGEFPTGERTYWKIHIVDEMPSISELKGVQQRLKNLGYYEGDCHGEMDEVVRGALRWLQLDSGIAQSGEVDADTTAKLAELHGD